MSLLRRLLDDDAHEHARKARLLLGLLLAFNAGAWICALSLFRDLPLLLGMAMLAYSFGLRHAVDADHITAIDNVTRKLMQQGRQPLGVGLMFSLGHSTVVVLATLAVVGMTVAFRQHLGAWREAGGVIGATVSSLFLLVIAAMNWPALRAAWQALRRQRRAEFLLAPGHFSLHRHSHGPLLDGHGIGMSGNHRGDQCGDSGAVLAGPLTRLLAPLFRRVGRSWHMYPLGLLFGLTFDTATEIGLLGLAASEAARGLPLWSLLVFPLLFTAGMTLVDTGNGLLMQRAYGWAFVKPARKLWYNFTLTLISVATALLIGGAGLLGLLAGPLHFSGDVQAGLAGFSQYLNGMGLAIVGFCALAWGGALALERWRRLEQPEPEGSE